MCLQAKLRTLGYILTPNKQGARTCPSMVRGSWFGWALPGAETGVDGRQGAVAPAVVAAGGKSRGPLKKRSVLATASKTRPSLSHGLEGCRTGLADEAGHRRCQGVSRAVQISQGPRGLRPLLCGKARPFRAKSPKYSLFPPREGSAFPRRKTGCTKRGAAGNAMKV